LLPVHVDEHTTLNDIEALDCRGKLGDTLFLFLCRELCEEGINTGEAVDRAARAARDCERVADALESVLATVPSGE